MPALNPLLPLVKKLQEVLIAKGVSHTVTVHQPEANGLSVRWNHAKKRLQWFSRSDGLWLDVHTSLISAQSEFSDVIPALPLSQELSRLATQAIREQEDFELACMAGAELLNTYLGEVGWYKAEALNPVGAIMPEVEDGQTEH